MGITKGLKLQSGLAPAQTASRSGKEGLELSQVHVSSDSLHP